ncbi:MAG: gliding motility-associated-like protein, partial [Polaribacter sp.]
FKYFPTETAAVNGAPEVADKTSYFVNTTGEAWVRTLSNENCYKISKIELTVSYTPNKPYQETFISCDDLLDTDGNNTDKNSDTDGITYFNFSIATSEITNDEDVNVEFYETEQERTQSINKIQLSQNIANYRNKNIPNTTGNPFPIYYKLISKSNNNCQGLGQIYLQIDPVPIANTTANFDLCDDDLSGNTTDGINSGINLKDREASILGATQTLLDYDVTFHTSQLDANDLNSLGIPNTTNFSNTPQAGFITGDISEQTIFVRVQDKITLCISSPASFKVIVNPIPSVSKTITPFAVCDLDTDPRNRMAENIDLTTKNDEILTGKTNHRVAYYLTQPDAENNVEIINPTDFQNIISLTSFPTNFTSDDPAIQTIFSKIIDLGGNQCHSIFATFQLVIYPEPNIPLNISNYSDCDNISDIDADDANGRNGDISLKNKIPEILANYQPAEFADFSVSFYASLTAAEIGDPTNVLNENNFENSTNGQEIFVRVENIKNTPIVCVNARLSFKIMINPLPDFTVKGEENIEDPRIVCLNDIPLTLEAENPLATYTYQWTNGAGNPLGNDRTLDVTTAGKYTVTASEISPIGCSRKRTIVVEESNTATLDKSYITIVDEGNTIGNENNLSIVIDVITNDLGPGDYQFAVRNDDKNTTTLFQDEPLFENLEGGIYTIIVNDKNGCTPDTTLQVSVLQFPKFFTPNGDGINDTWILKGVNKTFYPNSSVNIFNRFGKLVAQIAFDGQGWNGTYNSKKLSSDDYWYTIILIPANTSKPTIHKTGNFSLIRK